MATVSNLSGECRIREVGPREGFQRGVLVSTEMKAHVINEVVAAGAKSVQTVSFVNAKIVPQWADAEDVLGLVERAEGVIYDALVLNDRGLTRAITARDNGLPVDQVSLLGGATRSVLNSNGIPGTVDEDFDSRIAPLIGRAKEAGLRVLAGVSAAYGDPDEGWTPVEVTLDVVRRLIDAGADQVYLGDSTGEATPQQIVEITGTIRDAVRFPLIVHIHDNRGQALAAIMAILLEGWHDIEFDTAIGGMGGCQFIEAAGNVCTEDTVFMLEGLGVATGFSLPRLVELVKEVQGLYDYPLATHVGHYGVPKWFADRAHATA